MKLFGYEIVDGDEYKKTVANAKLVDSYRDAVDTLKSADEELRGQLRSAQADRSYDKMRASDLKKQSIELQKELNAQIRYTSTLEKELIAADTKKVSATQVLGGGNKVKSTKPKPKRKPVRKNKK